MSNCDYVPRLHDTRTLALGHAIKDKHCWLASVRCRTGQGFNFTSFPTAESFQAYVERHGKDRWINELIPTKKHRDAFNSCLSADEEHLRLGPARFVIDVDMKSAARDPRFQDYLSTIERSVFAAVKDIVPASEIADQRVFRVLNCRPYNSEGGGWKDSAHLVFAGIRVDEHDRDAKNLAKRVKERLSSGGDSAGPEAFRLSEAVDLSIYHRFQPLRVAGSAKKAGDLPLLAEDGIAFRDTLVMGGNSAVCPTDVILAAPRAARRVAGLKRKSDREEPMEQFGDMLPVDPNNVVLKALYALFANPVGQALGWSDLEVQGMYSFAATKTHREMHIFRVRHTLSRAWHYCAAKERHNGGANHSFFIRVRDFNHTWTLSTACFINNRALACQSVNEALNQGQRARVRTGMGPWWHMRCPHSDPAQTDKWSKSLLTLNV